MSVAVALPEQSAVYDIRSVMQIEFVGFELPYQSLTPFFIFYYIFARKAIENARKSI